jgi:DNA-directed RNA polymerase subunit beta'
LEYFISTHGARKGLADTALKTADAGYLTRRLVDVSQDVIINESDCGTLRGLTATALKNNEETVETLYDRILGRTSLLDIYHPTAGKLIIEAGEELTEEISQIIEDSPIEAVEIRSVLPVNPNMVYVPNVMAETWPPEGWFRKEKLLVLSLHSLLENPVRSSPCVHSTWVVPHRILPLHPRSMQNMPVFLRSMSFGQFHLRMPEGRNYFVVIGRSAEMRIVDKNTRMVLTSQNIPYGANLYYQNGQKVESGDLICEWDPYNAVIISDVSGKVVFNNMIEGTTYRTDSDEQTGYYEKVIIETKDKTRNPSISIIDANGEEVRLYDMPVGAHIVVSEGKALVAGSTIAKIPRAVGKSGDITGGLPRITELFEARNPSDPAVVSEIDGVVSFGKKIKRGNREVIITSKTGDEKRYLVALSKQILAQENDFVKAGTPLSDGPITPADILAIKGPTAVQEYIVNEVQEVYRMQGVKINDKHFEIIVRQMMRKVTIDDPGDTRFLENEIVNKIEFMEENDSIFGKKVVVDAGESNLKPGQIITARKLRDENSLLRRRDKALVTARDANGATARQQLQGITKASLQTKSFISAASFQETTKVLTDAAVNAKRDGLNGLKENVIVGHLIPAGTGLRDYENIIVGSMEEYDMLMASKNKSVSIEL